MFTFPDGSSPEFEAYLVGFLVPFLAAAAGFSIGAVRSMLSRLDKS